MDAAQSNFPLATADPGPLPDGLVYNQGEPSTCQLRQLETRPHCTGNRCILNELERPKQPPFCLAGKCLQKIWQEQSTITMVIPQWHSCMIPNTDEMSSGLPPEACGPATEPSKQFHPLITQGSLKLFTYRVSGNNTLQQGFQKGVRAPTDKVEHKDKHSLSVGMGTMES